MTAPAPTHDSTLPINGVGLYVEERGSGAPIVCIHGAGGTTLAWTSAIDKLSRLGRVIAYDRRGCARSERPAHYKRTSIAEHADDAAALIDALGAAPAVVIGRSYGATVATDLALRYPDRVRALVLLEGDASREQAPAVAAYVDRLTDRLLGVAARDGVDAVAKALVTEVADERAWLAFPDEIRRAPGVKRPGDPRRASGRMVAERRRGRARHASTSPRCSSPPPTRRPSSASRSKRSPRRSPTLGKRSSAAVT